jgi:hypothetical protein
MVLLKPTIEKMTVLSAINLFELDGEDKIDPLLNGWENKFKPYWYLIYIYIQSILFSFIIK